MSKGKVNLLYAVALADILLARFEKERGAQIDQIYQEGYKKYKDATTSFWGIFESIGWNDWIGCYFLHKEPKSYTEFKMESKLINNLIPRYWTLAWLVCNDIDFGHRTKDVIALKAIKSLAQVTKKEEIWVSTRDASILSEAVEEYNNAAKNAVG